MRQRETLTVSVIVLLMVMAGGAVFAQESFLAGPEPETGPPERLKSAMPRAKVGDEVITVDEVRQALQGELAELERQRRVLLRQKLEQLIGQRLLAREARRRGLTMQRLLEEEVVAKAPEVSDAEVTAFITENRARLPQGDEAELRPKVFNHLRLQKVRQQGQAYLQALREQTHVSVNLDEPEALRKRVSPDKGLARGATRAPVTIVEFADFQCPFCKAVLPTVTQLVEKYPEKVKWVFRDFPIASLHPAAPKAHEAARCAADGGKFWEYHDLLYERSPRHSIEELKQYAQELGLDGSAFTHCLDSGKYREEVDGDVREGIRLSVSGTPTFFVNGRILVGAQPLGVFEKLVEDELAQNAAP